MTAVPFYSSRGEFINLAVVLVPMSEEIMNLLRMAGRIEPLSPSKRIRDFLIRIQRTKISERIEVDGFLILRQPPHPPMDAAYYMLSPLSPSELKNLPKDAPRTYLVLRITEKSEVSGKLHSGAYVKASGVIDAYPWGNMRMLHVERLCGEDYSNYWLQYKDFALRKNEFEALFMDTLYANYDLEKALIYSLFASPTLMGTNKPWGEGISFSAIKTEQRIAFSVWEALRYIHSLLPWELRLKREKWVEYTDPFLDIDFRLRDPNGTNLEYYTPTSRTLLKKELPAPKWAEHLFKNKKAVFLVSKSSKILPDDPVAYLSETPFILTEPVAYERNPELERLMPNVVATIFLERAKVGSLNIGSKQVETFRRKFEEWLAKNRNEYGEKFDALRLSGMVFETNTRYLLSIHLLGAMARFEGALKRSIINDVLLINQELLDLWINEVPEKVLLRLLEEYERYVSSDRRVNLAISIFMDIEATTVDGTVTKDEFFRALLKYGFKPADAQNIIEGLIREGYLYEPLSGRLRLIR